jgi:hypothetical protein
MPIGNQMANIYLVLQDLKTCSLILSTNHSAGLTSPIVIQDSTKQIVGKSYFQTPKTGFTKLMFGNEMHSGSGYTPTFAWGVAGFTLSLVGKGL